MTAMPVGQGDAGVATLTHRLDGGPSSPSAARAHLRDALGAGDTSEVAQLIVSELVTNAVRHSEPPIELQIQISDEKIRIAVEDGSAAPPQPRVQADDVTSGRGLLLVDALAAAWGWHRVEGGKTVWFEL